MHNFFYSKLACTNIKKNGKFYFPYLLTCVGTVMMFYLTCFLSQSPSVSKMPGGDSMAMILSFGTVVVGLFAAIFLFYTNSFLIKRRKKEFGLFNILGMDKKNLGFVVGIENIIVTVIGIVGGILCGIIFSKLMVMLLGKLLNATGVVAFEISVPAILITAVVFIIIFTLIFISNQSKVFFSRPIELIYGQNQGEREPKTKIFMTIIGILALAGGYYMALTVKNPVEAIAFFFLAVILVIIGTYLIFISGSITILKLLRKNKGYYYKTSHFISVSGMIYRMKQNAAGLASICILSTMVLVMISSTVSLYIGIDDVIRRNYPRNIQIIANGVDVETADTIYTNSAKSLEEAGIKCKDVVKYRAANAHLYYSDGIFTDMMDEVDNSHYTGVEVLFTTISEYNSLQNEQISLDDDEVIILSTDEKYQYNTARFLSDEYTVISSDELNISQKQSVIFTSRYSYYVIFSDETKIYNTFSLINSSDENEDTTDIMKYYLLFDVEGGSQNCDLAAETVRKELLSLGDKVNSFSIFNSSEATKGIMASDAGLFFLGLFLGTLFIMATALIIYYKQVSEGYEDKDRFEIMQNVGMSRSEVKHTVKTQVLTVFFLPLLVSVIHLCGAFKMIALMLSAMGLTNITLYLIFSLVTVLGFALIYTLIYLLTARVYYKIVE